MDSPDIEGLIEHFNEKITMISELIPLVKLCHSKRGVISSSAYPHLRKIELSSETEEEVSTNKEMPLPDLSAMTEMIMEMRDMIATMKRLNSSQSKKLDQQRDRCYMRIAGLREHLKYLQNNIPASWSFLQRNTKTRKPVVAAAVVGNKGSTTARKTTAAVCGTARKAALGTTAKKPAVQTGARKPPPPIQANQQHQTAGETVRKPVGGPAVVEAKKPAAAAAVTVDGKKPFLRRGQGKLCSAVNLGSSRGGPKNVEPE